MELHGGQRQVGVLHRHDDPVVALRRHLEQGRQFLADREERVVAARGELARQPGEEPPAPDLDTRGLAVHGVVEHTELAPQVLHDALEPEADPEGRNPAREQRVQRPRQIEIARRAGAGREDHQVGPQVVEDARREAGPPRRHLSTGLAEIVRQRVDERVLVVDQEHAAARAFVPHLHPRARLRAPWAPEGVEEGGGLQPRLLLLGVGLGVVEERRPDAHLGGAVLDPDGAEGEPGIEVAVEAEEPDRAAVPGAGRPLVVLDELHGPRLRRPRDGDRPRVREEGVERVELGTEPPLHVIHGVDESRVHLDLAAADHPHAARDADARLVVAVHVGAHRQLRLVLGRVEQRPDLDRVGDGVAAARDRARDRAGLDAVAGHAHVHLGGSAHQVLRLPEVHQEPVGRGVALAEAAEQLRRRRRAGLEESLAGDHLEEIAALEGLAGQTDDGRVRAGLVVTRAGHRGGARERARRRRRAGQAGGGVATRLEVVAAPLSQLTAMVDDDQLVGEIEHEIALVGRARQARPDRLELKREIVAEGPVQPEVWLLGVPEEIDQHAEQREHRGLAATVLFREAHRGRADRDRHRVVRSIEALDEIDRLECLGDGGEQDQTARVQRLGA